MSDSPLPIAGWYADPENAAGERWWNGSSWSESRRARAAGAPPAAAATPVPRPNPYALSTPAAANPYAAPNPSATPNPYATPAGYTAPNPYAAPTPYGAYGAAPSSQNTTAIVGFVISLVGLFTNVFFFGLGGIAGGIVSVIGLTKAKQLQAQGIVNTGRPLALAGVIIGFGSVALSVLFLIIYIVATVSTSSY